MPRDNLELMVNLAQVKQSVEYNLSMFLARMESEREAEKEERARLK